MMRDYIMETGLFDVEIARTNFIWQGPHNAGLGTNEARDSLLALYRLDGETAISLDTPTMDGSYAPVFGDYDVVICNFGLDAAPWPAATQRKFEEYMKNGGGLVIVHAANNSFGDWDAYNRMIGIGGWSGRDSTSGDFIFYNAEGEIKRMKADRNCGSHGPESDFIVRIREPDHPITRGMPAQWLHVKDEIYQNLCGPAEGVRILATAYAAPGEQAPPWDPDNPGTGRHEPVLLTGAYGKGRVFHTTLGHADYSMECVGFITSLQRGTEWAATGSVTQSLPDNFPMANQISRADWD